MLAETMDRFESTENGWAALCDTLAERGDPRFAFRRARWFAGGTPVVLAGTDGSPVGAWALARRRAGPFSLAEVSGGYWPFRGINLDPAARIGEVAEALTCAGGPLGRVWRLGPVAADDPALAILLPAARAAGWHPLVKPLGTLFELDLPEAGEAWPSAATQRKNRWRRRRLEAESGALRTESFTGADWTAAQRDAMAAIEAASWLAHLPGGGDTKFRDPAMRGFWEELCADPQLAARLFGSLLWIGERPAAFTFGIAAGGVRYYIANNFDERFTRHGPGRVLLYEDFARARDQGVRRISWGLGDGGYKSEMGARPGPALHDILFVRGALTARLAGMAWTRRP